MVEYYPVGKIQNLKQIIIELKIAGERLKIQAGVMKQWSERFYAFAEALSETKGEKTMADIAIVVRRDRAFLIPESEVGRKWLDANISGDKHVVSIQSEHIEDMIKDMKEAELSIEY